MYEQVIVADSSPLIGLAKIHLLEILPKLSSRILILEKLKSNGIYIRQELIDAILKDVGE